MKNIDKQSVQEFVKSSDYARRLKQAYPEQSNYLIEHYTRAISANISNKMFTVNYNNHTA